jgi:acetyltransferase-like isoleucine patch superfamily enzyme
MSQAAGVFVHPTALVESGVRLGEGTRVWDSVHIRRDARIGRSCIIGEKTYIAYEVAIGDFCKLNAAVYVCAGVVIEDFCMLSAHTVFTNDRYPRAGNRALDGLETSDVTEETLVTRVGRGVTTGANATIGPGLTLGEFAMVGMGSVVTRDVPPHALVVGNPATVVGWLCVCGHPLAKRRDLPPANEPLACERCQRSFVLGPAGLRQA